jgi:hypothetical protein
MGPGYSSGVWIRLVATAAALVTALLALSGCHLIYPFDVVQVEAGPIADAGVDVCNEPVSIRNAKQCTNQCVSSLDDKDCDGLKDSVQDSWDSVCNWLMTGEEFVNPPWQRWEMTYSPNPAHKGVSCGVSARCVQGDSCNGTICKTSRPLLCGKLHIESGQTFTLVDPGLLLYKTYMVELRIRVDKITSSTDWSFGVTGNRVDSNSAQYRRTCAMWLNKTPNLTDCKSGCAHVVGLHMNHTVTQGIYLLKTGIWTEDIDNKIKDPTGQYFLLQLWGDTAEQHCRLLSADGSKEVIQRKQTTVVQAKLPGDPNPVAVNLNPSQPGTIHLSASNCQVTIDYVRVFQHEL